MPGRQPPTYSRVRVSSLARALMAHIVGDADATLAALSLRYPGRNLLLTSSGTAALTLALQQSARDRREPPVVGIPAFACPDLGTAAIGAGARIVLYDVDPHMLAPDLDSVRRALKFGVTHLVVTHLFGRLVDVPSVCELVRADGVQVIEDAAQHAGATLRGVRAGSLADWGVLSFGRGKGLNAGGGGALVTSSAASIDVPVPPTPPLSMSLSHLVKATAGELLAHPLVYWVPHSIPALQLGETVYRAPTAPMGASRTQCTLLEAALADEPASLARRRALAAWYAEALTARPGILFDVPPDPGHGGALRFPVRLTPWEGERLGAFGVARSYPRILDAYPAIRERLVGGGGCPGATELASSVYTLPTHERIDSGTRERLVRALLKDGLGK